MLASLLRRSAFLPPSTVFSAAFARLEPISPLATAMDATNDMNKYSLVGKTKEFLSSFASVRAEEGRELAKRDLLLLMRAGARGKDVSLIRQSLEELSGRGELDQDVHTAALFALAKNAEFKVLSKFFSFFPSLLLLFVRVRRRC